MKTALVTMYHETEKDQATRMFHHYIDAYGKMVDEIHLKKYDFLNIPEHEARNRSIKNLKGIDFIIMLDSDEWLFRKDMETLLKYLSTLDKKPHVVSCGMEDYLSPSEVREPKRGFQPVLAVSPQVRFVDKRCCDTRFCKTKVMDFDIQHLTFLHDKEWKRDMWAKRQAKGEKNLTSEPLDFEGVREILPPVEIAILLSGMTGAGNVEV